MAAVVANLRSLVPVALVCLTLIVPDVNGCGRSGGGSRATVVRNNKPYLACPGNIDTIADRLQDHTKVTWEEPVAQDAEDGKITPRRVGRPPGKLFSGTSTITYSARDKNGNTASCSFTITVRVLKCPFWASQEDGWKWCHTSFEMRRGARCRFGCYAGHVLHGPSLTECLDSEQWDTPTQPVCNKVQCNTLLPSSDQQHKVSIVCTDRTNYRSICSYVCEPGYSVLPGSSKVRVCSQNTHWLGTEPICHDTSPPSFLNCPSIRVGYAERGKTTGRVFWPTLRAEDNSGSVTIVQTKGPESGTELPVGDYDVTYMAYDAANNSAMCDFKLVVKQIRCPTIYPLPYTHVTCPNGRIYGAACNFTCDNGTSLNANRYAECSSESEGNIRYGQWSFGNHQPYCELQETCPALPAPDNGALACDVWQSGKFCKMYCQEGYTVGGELKDQLTQKRLLVCGDSGNWLGFSTIPNCMRQIPVLLQIYHLGVEYYYSGNCSAVMDEIRQKFIAEYTSKTENCKPPDCSISNVKVICGATTNRKKRETVALTVEFDQTSNSTTLAESFRERSAILTGLTSAQASGSLTIEIGVLWVIVAGVTVSQPVIQCPAGSMPDGTSLSCIECGPGTYHDENGGSCERCARGFYQTDSAQPSCLSCPFGQTTAQLGARSLSECTAACEPGYFSFDGTPPCSLCDVGTYSATYGASECTSCPGSQTTLTPGCSSSSSCQEFDILYSELDPNETMIPARVAVILEQPVSGIHVDFWVKCSTCGGLVSVTDPAGMVVLGLRGDTELTLTRSSQTSGSAVNTLSARKWSHVVVSSFSDVTTVALDGDIVISEVGTVSMATEFNITIGADNFIGSLSQLQMSSSVPLTLSTSTCFNGYQGDVLSWRSFDDTDGTFTKVGSSCDAQDDCSSNPCINGATCTDKLAQYECACPAGYTGVTCEINIDDCLNHACDNKAICQDGVDGYSCLCPYGFKGELCEIQVVDGQWAAWSDFGSCSVTCGTGVHSRERVCTDPEPTNGGKACEGPNNETQACTMEDKCIYECNDVPPLDNGSMNCTWIDAETRTCYPYCDDGYDFDSLLFLNNPDSPISCGINTAYVWNIVNDDNPFSQLPSCTPKQQAEKITVFGFGEYPNLDAAADVEAQVTSLVEGVVLSTEPLTSGKVSYGGIRLNDVIPGRRKRRETSSVTFTVYISCVPESSIDECNDLLQEVLQTLEQAIANQALTVTVGGQTYDVNVNNTSWDGSVTCPPGFIPVYHYCVPCGLGTYQDGLYCERCPRGSYQDEMGQTGCKACPDGTWTEGLNSRQTSQCTVSDPRDDEATILTVATIVGSIAGFVVILLAVTIIMYLCCCKGTSNATSPSPLTIASGDKGMDNRPTRFKNPSYVTTPSPEPLQVGEYEATGMDKSQTRLEKELTSLSIGTIGNRPLTPGEVFLPSIDNDLSSTWADTKLPL